MAMKRMMIPKRRRKRNKKIKVFYKEWLAISFLDVGELLRDENFFLKEFVKNNTWQQIYNMQKSKKSLF